LTCLARCHSDVMGCEGSARRQGANSHRQPRGDRGGIAAHHARGRLRHSGVAFREVAGLQAPHTTSATSITTTPAATSHRSRLAWFHADSWSRARATRSADCLPGASIAPTRPVPQGRCREGRPQSSVRDLAVLTTVRHLPTCAWRTPQAIFVHYRGVQAGNRHGRTHGPPSGEWSG
jgi:hypothetical protein